MNNIYTKYQITDINTSSQIQPWCKLLQPPNLLEGCICLSTCVKNVLFTQYYRFCASTRALEFFLLNTAFWASTYPPQCIHTSVCPSDIQQRPCSTCFKQQYRIKGMHKKTFQASAQLNEFWILQWTVIGMVMVMTAIMTSMQSVSWQILGFLVFFLMSAHRCNLSNTLDVQNAGVRTSLLLIYLFLHYAKRQLSGA